MRKPPFRFINKGNLFAILNIFIPLVIGVLLYNTPVLYNTKFINYVPDGLWAYSFSISIFWIWKWEINTFNIITILITEIIFEILQKTKYISGTFDGIDILTYVFFSIISIVVIKKRNARKIINNLITNRNRGN